MMISLGLMTRFGQINDRLDTMQGKVGDGVCKVIDGLVIFAFLKQSYPETVWIEVREDYVQVCELMERVDHEIGFLILFSNLDSLFFTCIQLLRIYMQVKLNRSF